ncbi:MAG: molybdopterin-dependent oxidoreductase [Candidatus Tectomicrobia bacterium]|nr:molybdopterin-dependent oxidoreductase [Candidatus Tectomicrobia bacterium]
MLGLPLTKVRVIGTAVGGGFGGKKPRTDPYAALLALRTGKPVRVQFTRDEEFVAGFPRHPTIIHLRTGAKRDGRLTAREARLYYDTGAYTDHGPTVAALGAIYAKGPYRIPNVRLESFTIYTHKTISGAFRGYGNPQSAFAVESQMDIMARDLGFDPVDFRRRNALEDGDMLANGQRFPRIWLKRTLDAAARRAMWQERIPPGNHKRRGRGVACGQHHAGGLTSSATVKVMEDGTVQAASGVIEIGAGQVTMAAMVAAEELSVDVEDVRLVSADTDGTPFEYYSAASRITYNVGNAVRLAAADAKRQLLERASEILEVPAEDLAVENQRVFMPGAPEKGLAFGQIVKEGHTKKGGPILGRGVFDPHGPPVVADYMDGNPRKPMLVMTFCTHVAEVEVDVETGQVEILRLFCVHDVGRVINQGAIEGQVEGGVTQGVGFALMEEVVYSGGVVTNPTLADYKVPNILDAPRVECEFIEEPEPTGPFGAKGVAEAVLVPTAAAIANAVFDAVGVRVMDLPLTPEKVLAGLNAKRAG